VPTGRSHVWLKVWQHSALTGLQKNKSSYKALAGLRQSLLNFIYAVDLRNCK